MANTFPSSGNAGIGTLTPAFPLDVVGSVHASGNLIEQYCVFTPTTVGWYRIISATPERAGGTIRISAGSYDNTYTDIEFQFSAAGYGMPIDLTQTRFLSYNGGAVSQGRISTNGGAAIYLDIYISTAVSPTPITVFGYGPNVPTFITTPVVGATAGSNAVVQGFGRGIALSSNVFVAGTSYLNALQLTVLNYGASSGNIQIDFSQGSYASLGLNGATSFSPSGSAAVYYGRTQVLDIANTSGSSISISWNSSWKLASGLLPTVLAAGAYIRVTLMCTGASESSIVVSCSAVATGNTVQSIAALRALTGMSATVDEYRVVESYGQYPGDGGGGIFFWVAADNYSSDNDGTLIAGGFIYWSASHGSYTVGSKVALNQKIERGQNPGIFVCAIAHNPSTYGTFAAALAAGAWTSTTTTGYWHRLIGPATQGGSQVPTTKVDVRWFGAVGDASTDATPGVLDAFFALQFPGQYYLGDLYFPAGEYRFATKCVLSPGSGNLSVSISGDGPFATTLIYGFLTADTAMLDLSGNGASGISVKNLGFGYRNYGTTVPSTDIIYAHGAAFAIIENIYAANLTGNFLHITAINAGVCISNVNTTTMNGTQFLLDGVGGTLQGFNVNTGFSTPCIWIKNCDALKVTGGQASGGGPYVMYPGTTISGSTLTTPTAHGFTAGDWIVLSNPTSHPGYVGRYQIVSVPSSTTLTLTGVPSLGSDTVRLDSLWSCCYMGGGLCTESSISNVIWNTGGSPGVGSVGMHLDGFNNGSCMGILVNNVLCDFGWTGIFVHGMPQFSGFNIGSALSTITITSNSTSFTVTPASYGVANIRPGLFIKIEGTTMGKYDGFYLVDSVTSTSLTVLDTRNLGTDTAGACYGAVLASTCMGNFFSQATAYPADDFGGIRIEGAYNTSLTDIQTPGNPATVLVSAGNFVTGAPYKIATLGTTDFTLIGASSNMLGVHFVATGPGSGTGNATVDNLGLFLAGTLVVNNTYEIVSAGTTNFVAIGAANNSPGTIFRATGAGSGTGTAAVINNRIVISDGGAYGNPNNYPVSDFRVNGGSVADSRQVEINPCAIFNGFTFDGPYLFNCSVVNPGIQAATNPLVYSRGAAISRGISCIYTDAVGALQVYSSQFNLVGGYYSGLFGSTNNRINGAFSINNSRLVQLDPELGNPSGGSPCPIHFDDATNQFFDLASNAVFTSAGLASGAWVMLTLSNTSGAAVTLSWPSGWNWHNGGSGPTSLPNNQSLSYNLLSFGTTDAKVFVK